MTATETTCRTCGWPLDGAVCPFCGPVGPPAPEPVAAAPDEPGTVLPANPTDTQRVAALRALPKSGTKRAAVLEFIRAHGPVGATDEEIQLYLYLSPNTERPRRVELVRGGWVRASDLRRPTADGNPSIVWVATETD